MRSLCFLQRTSPTLSNTLTSSIRSISTAQLYQLENPKLSDRAREYHKNGYLVVPQLFDPQELQSIKQEMIETCRGNLVDIDGAKIWPGYLSAQTPAQTRILAPFHPKRHGSTLHSVSSSAARPANTLLAG